MILVCIIMYAALQYFVVLLFCTFFCGYILYIKGVKNKVYCDAKTMKWCVLKKNRQFNPGRCLICLNTPIVTLNLEYKVSVMDLSCTLNQFDWS